MGSSLGTREKYKQGWKFAKGSWNIFRSDKEMVVFPAISTVLTFGLLIPFFLVLAHNKSGVHKVGGQHYYTGWPLVAWIVFLLAVTIISNFFSAAVMQAAMERFKGGDPTLGSCIRAVRRKFLPLLAFSVFMGTIGIVFQLLIERLPFAAKLVAFIGSVSWSVANFFSLPIVLFSEESVAPLDAAKESVELVKKTWGESVVASGSIGIISGLILMAFILVWTILFTIIVSVKVAKPVIFTVGVIGIIGFIVGIVMASVLGGIVKAALYYYATTGNSPVFFDNTTLQSAMRPKLSRRLLGR